MDEVMEKIQSLIFNRFGIEISYEEPILENGIDSLNIIELIVDIEVEYNIEFEASSLNYRVLRSIESISKYVFEQIHKDW